MIFDGPFTWESILEDEKLGFLNYEKTKAEWKFIETSSGNLNGYRGKGKSAKYLSMPSTSAIQLTNRYRGKFNGTFKNIEYKFFAFHKQELGLTGLFNSTLKKLSEALQAVDFNMKPGNEMSLFAETCENNRFISYRKVSKESSEMLDIMGIKEAEEELLLKIDITK